MLSVARRRCVIVAIPRLSAPQIPHSRCVFSDAVTSHLIELRKREDAIGAAVAGGDLSSEELTAMSKEMNDLQPVIERLRTLEEKRSELDDLKDLVQMAAKGDEEIVQLANEEMPEIESYIEKVEADVLRLLLPKDKCDDGNAMLEVRAGAGGDEAGLFAMDVFEMYEKYAQLNRWKFEIFR